MFQLGTPICTWPHHISLQFSVHKINLQWKIAMWKHFKIKLFEYEIILMPYIPIQILLCKVSFVILISHEIIIFIFIIAVTELRTSTSLENNGSDHSCVILFTWQKISHVISRFHTNIKHTNLMNTSQARSFAIVGNTKR